MNLTIFARAGLLFVSAYCCFFSIATAAPNNFKEINSRLPLAIEAGDLKRVEKLIADGSLVDRYDSKKGYPLYVAFHSGKRDIITLLLAHGTQPDIFDESGELLSIAAMRAGDYALVKELLAHGANPFAENRNHESLISVIAEKTDPAQFFTSGIPLKKNAESSDNSCDKEALNNALERAVIAGNYAGAETLLRWGADVNSKSYSRGTFLLTTGTGFDDSLELEAPLITRAILSSDERMFALLLSHGAKVGKAKEIENVSDNYCRTPLDNAAMIGNCNAIKALLKAGAVVNSRYEEGMYDPLSEAVLAGQLAAVKLLVASGADLNAPSRANLMEDGLKKTYCGLTPLHCAASTGNVGILKFLLDHKSDPLRVSYGGLTPLHVACFNGKSEAAALLLKYSPALRYRKDKEGSTALRIALAYGKNDVAWILLKGCDFSKEMQSDLFSAGCFGADISIIKELYKPAYLKKKDKFGWLPIGYAALRGDADIVAFLLDSASPISGIYNKENIPDIFQESPHNFSYSFVRDQAKPTLFSLSLCNPSVTVLTLLRDRGIGTAEDWQSSLYALDDNAGDDVVRFLVDNNAVVDSGEGENFPFALAVRSGKFSLASKLFPYSKDAVRRELSRSVNEQNKNEDEEDDDDVSHYEYRREYDPQKYDLASVVLYAGESDLALSILECAPENYRGVLPIPNFREIKNVKNDFSGVLKYYELEKFPREAAWYFSNALDNGDYDLASGIATRLSPRMRDVLLEFALKNRDNTAIPAINAVLRCTYPSQSFVQMMLLEAIKYQNDQLVWIFLDYCDTPDFFNGEYSPFLVALSSGNKKLARIMMGMNADLRQKDSEGNTPFALASKGGLSDMLSELLVDPAYVNLPNDEGESPLMLASYAGNIEICRQLVALGADVRFRNSHQESALHFAAKGNKPDVCSYLLSNGAVVNALTYGNDTPLMYAAANGSLEALKVLADAGGDINQHKGGSAPLLLAIKSRSIPSIKFLVSKGAKLKTSGKGEESAEGLPDYLCDEEYAETLKTLIALHIPLSFRGYRGEGLLHYAGGYRSERIPLLLSVSPSLNFPDTEGYFPLYYAMDSDSEEGVDAFVKAGVFTSSSKDKEEEENLLIYAAQRGRVDWIVQMQKKKSPLLNDYRSIQRAFYYAFKESHREVFTALLAMGKSPDPAFISSDNWGIIHVAASYGKVADVKALLKKGFFINQKDSDGLTPLEHAVDCDNISMARFLIAQGAEVKKSRVVAIAASSTDDKQFFAYLLKLKANPNLLTAGGTSAISGVMSNHKDWLPLLLSSGANINIADNEGWTPLMHLCDGSESEDIAFLLANGATVNVRSLNNETPLMVAARYGTEDTIQLLIDANADINAQNNDGETALLMAISKNNVSIVKLLFKAGAKHPDSSQIDFEYVSDEMKELLRENGITQKLD